MLSRDVRSIQIKDTELVFALSCQVRLYFRNIIYDNMLFNTRFDDMIVLENVADIAERPQIMLHHWFFFSVHSCFSRTLVLTTMNFFKVG